MKKNWPALLLAVFALCLHFALNSRYNYQRDELYFIACGNHLDWGYVDVGPLPMWIGRLSREVFGDSLFGWRFFPAIAHAATLFLTAVLAGRFGARAWGRFVAGLSVLIAPLWLSAGNILSLPSFEPFFWVLAAFFLVRLIQDGDSRNWLWFGITVGFGLLNKPSMLFLGMALVVGMALTPQRKYFKDKWLYIGGFAALAISSPFLIYWQLTHDWATLDFLVGMNRGLMSQIPAAAFVLGQFVYLHPFNALLWIGGIFWCLLARDARPYRIFGIMFMVVFLFLLVVKSKIYYLGPAYPMVLAAGAAAWQAWLDKPARRWAKAAIPAVMCAGGTVTAFFVLPILPIEKLDAYANIITFGLAKNIYEVTGTAHDQFGWENQVKVVASVYEALAPEEKAACVLFGTNFGRAGAIDYYGPRYGLPPAYGPHQNYYFWGPPKTKAGTLICLGGKPEDLKIVFEDVTEAARAECPQAVVFEQRVPVYLCRKPRMEYADIWPLLRPRAFLN